MNREKIKELAWKACLIEDDQEVTQDVLAFANAIEREILGRSHFVRLPSGGYIRGDEVMAVRTLDASPSICGVPAQKTRIVVSYTNGCTVIDCESDSIRNNMADAIMRDIDAAVAAITGDHRG